MYHVANVVIITKGSGPSHYAIHSFFNGLEQFQYNDIWLA